MASQLAAALLSTVAADATNAAVQPGVISLDGEWRFAVEEYDNALGDGWIHKPLPGRIKLPGSMPEQGLGDDVTVKTKWTGSIFDTTFFTAPEYEKYRQPGNFKVPFWLQPEKYYAGLAWYQRDIEIPEAWRGKRIVLTLERPHWETHVWLDNAEEGVRNSLSTPHEYDFGMRIGPGKHTLNIRVDNRAVIDIGVNSHSITDHTQGNWNGIVGRIELSATESQWIDDVQVFPSVEKKSVTVRGTVESAAATPDVKQVKLDVGLYNTAIDKSHPIPAVTANVVADGTFTAEIPLGKSAELWDEFHPALYRLTARLPNGETKTVTFGLREFSTNTTQFLVNGRKTFFRGTLECCIFPKTGHPPTDVESWKRIIRIAKAHGLNHLRFHSWCPPEAAFIAGDELGMYFQIECASWANQGATVGDGKPLDRWLYDEADRILKTYGNHPSLVLMTYGNEPSGAGHKAYLADWVRHYEQKDARHLYTGASGWPELAENQYEVTPLPRIQQWGDGLKSRINAKPPETLTDYRDFIAKHSVPVISHEIGQWCAYPNFDEIPKYTGYLKPKNFEIFRDSLAEHHMAAQAHDFLIASGKLQTLCYKEEIESALRTPGMGGFQLLDLHDFPGQGTALVGVLDPFWESKGYVTPQEYSRFCNSTVPLARLAKRVFTADEKITADLEVAHFGAAPIENAVTNWKLVTDDGATVASGKLPAKTIPVDNGVALGSISIGLEKVNAPARCKLVVGIEGTSFENDWDVWIYPPTVETKPPAAITVVHELDDTTLAALQAGGRILLAIPPARVAPDPKQPVALGFSSIFWNTAWTKHQAPHTLGILCDPKNPALAEFPTDSHINWQWWYLVSRAGAMILDGLPADLRPTVQVIDDWFTNRKLGLVIEGKVGAGRILITSIDLQNGPGENPVARQMLHSLLDYMAGEKFHPAVKLTPAQIRNLTMQTK
jgi:hypothetical protein